MRFLFSSGACVSYIEVLVLEVKINRPIFDDYYHSNICLERQALVGTTSSHLSPLWRYWLTILGIIG
jgi:hypothetical protein